MKTIYDLLKEKRLKESETVNVDGEEIQKSNIKRVFGKIYPPRYGIAVVDKISINSKEDYETFMMINDKYYYDKYIFVKTNVELSSTEFSGENYHLKLQCKNQIKITNNARYVSLMLSDSDNCDIIIKNSYDMVITGNVKTINAMNSSDINLDGKIKNIYLNGADVMLYNDSNKCSVDKIVLKNKSSLSNDDGVEINSKDIDNSSKYYE